MVEIGLSTVASVFAVFVLHLHSKWVNGIPVPHWLLQLACLEKRKQKTFIFTEKRGTNMISTHTQVRNIEHFLFLFFISSLK